MESKELADLLRSAADILDHYKGKKMDEVVHELLLLVKSNNTSQKEVSKNHMTSCEVVEVGVDYSTIILKLNQMSGKEITAFLNEDKTMKTKKDLLAFAKALSLSSSTRQTKEVIKHSIVKYFERRKMDDLIRVERDRSF